MLKTNIQKLSLVPGAGYCKRNTQKDFYSLVDAVEDLVVVRQLLEAEKNWILLEVVRH